LARTKEGVDARLRGHDEMSSPATSSIVITRLVPIVITRAGG
jgi:hypothetical protein